MHGEKREGERSTNGKEVRRKSREVIGMKLEYTEEEGEEEGGKPLEEKA